MESLVEAEEAEEVGWRGVCGSATLALPKGGI